MPICENVNRADRLMVDSMIFGVVLLFMLSKLATANVLSRLYSGGKS